MKKCPAGRAPLLKGLFSISSGRVFWYLRGNEPEYPARDPTPSTVENRHVRRTTGAPERAYRENGTSYANAFQFVTRRMTCWFFGVSLTDLCRAGVKGVVTADMLGAYRHDAPYGQTLDADPYPEPPRIRGPFRRNRRRGEGPRRGIAALGAEWYRKEKRPDVSGFLRFAKEEARRRELVRGILMPSERRMHVNGVARGAGAGHLQL